MLVYFIVELQAGRYLTLGLCYKSPLGLELHVQVSKALNTVQKQSSTFVYFRL